MAALYTRIRDWSFLGVLLGIAFLLGMELREFADRNGLWLGRVSFAPVRPSAATNETDRFVTATETSLREPIVFSPAGGVLYATGSIDEGAASRLANILEAVGARVRTVSLNSPGGALDDAITMGRLLREHRLSAIVEDGAICASSCPLVLAGGLDRLAGTRAAIGLHQFYAASDAAEIPAETMADTQLTTARISRHLSEMGVDPALWLHALETPPRALYYLDGGEMRRYRLVTGPEEKPARR